MRLACPPDLVVTTADDSARVDYPPPAVAGAVKIGCAPASGSSFPLGRSTTTCTATEGRRQAAACTFTVTVNAIATLGATHFVAFGDSITEGKLPSGALVRSPYPAVLQQLLAARYRSQIFVVENHGVGSETTDAGLARLPAALAPDAEVLLLVEGVNDLAFGNPAAIEPAIANLDAMVRAASDRGARVFVGTLLPEFAGGSPDRSRARPLIEPANDRIRAMAARQGAEIVDLHHAFVGLERSLIGADGLHPTEAGYETIAAAFFDAIRQRLEPLPSRSFVARALLR